MYFLTLIVRQNLLSGFSDIICRQRGFHPAGIVSSFRVYVLLLCMEAITKALPGLERALWIWDYKAMTSSETQMGFSQRPDLNRQVPRIYGPGMHTNTSLCGTRGPAGLEGTPLGEWRATKICGSWNRTSEFRAECPTRAPAHRPAIYFSVAFAAKLPQNSTISL